MFESIITTAYVIGLVSAVSLPMGAVTTFFWNPSERTIAILMAFGGGALLAALTIDMVASAVDKRAFLCARYRCGLRWPAVRWSQQRR